MARRDPRQEQQELFEAIRERLVKFTEFPDHQPCSDSRCVYCRVVEGQRVFDLLKSLGHYLKRADAHV